eukprot:GHVU01022385.1.p1 GENE.GHVU01022385.1~~GHVU01022385.1.p1  ORF type:complete len:175 (+),score=48.94 GHVU01022385.1:130-654(+)
MATPMARMHVPSAAREGGGAKEGEDGGGGGEQEGDSKEGGCGEGAGAGEGLPTGAAAAGGSEDLFADPLCSFDGARGGGAADSSAAEGAVLKHEGGDDDDDDDELATSASRVLQLSTEEEAERLPLRAVCLPLPGEDVLYPSHLRPVYERFCGSLLGLQLSDFKVTARGPLDSV